MKIILLILCSIFIFSFCMQKENKPQKIINTGSAGLKIRVIDCRDPKKIYNIGNIIVFKSKKIIEQTKSDQRKSLIIENLEPGIYTIIYETIFNKLENQTVNILDNKIYPVDLCGNYIDNTKDSTKPVIDRLQENEKYKIYVEIVGCFQSEKIDITIHRDKKNFTINWNGRKKILDNNDIVAIRKFETELSHTRGDHGCTTTDTYRITYKGNTSEYIDDSCEWNGYIYLYKKIFDEKMKF